MGTALSSACVYGWAGCPNTSSASPTSTRRPEYITATRSTTWRTTDRSWPTNRYASPRRTLRCSSRLSTPAWMETSRADTGSSSTRRRGSRASARDADPLPLASGQVRGVPVGVLDAQAHEVEQVPHPSAAPVENHAEGPQRLGDDVAHGQPRVE